MFLVISVRHTDAVYRFNSDAKVIVVVWGDDDKTLRAYGSKTDAYATFKAMLEDGSPLDTFEAL